MGGRLIVQKRVVALTLFLAFLLFVPSGVWSDHSWNEVKEFPQAVLENFLQKPQNNLGHIDVFMRGSEPQKGAIIAAVDIRDTICIIAFRGIPGGRGFAIPHEDIYRFPHIYVLEVRWLDPQTGFWKIWWRREVLDSSLVSRKYALPTASNSPC